MPGAKKDRGSCLEVQIHSSDIRRGVRYLFVTRRQAATVLVSVVVWALVVAIGFVNAPQILSGLLLAREYEVSLSVRHQQGERLEALVARLAELQQQGESLRLQMSKIYLAYGFGELESEGQGGFPVATAEVPHSVFTREIRRGMEARTDVDEQIRVLAALLDEVQSFEAAHRDQARHTPARCPLEADEFVLTSPFGNRRNPFTKALDFHAGIDLAARTGTTIHAPADAVVTFAGRYDLKRSVSWWRYGNLVVLRHGENFVTLFGHCAEVLVRKGDEVRAGDPIATVGNTGWSTSPHLHYEVRRGGNGAELEPVDPRIYILDRRWRDEERLLVAGRTAPDARDYEPLPRLLAN